MELSRKTWKRIGKVSSLAVILGLAGMVQKEIGYIGSRGISIEIAMRYHGEPLKIMRIDKRFADDRFYILLPNGDLILSGRITDDNGNIIGIADCRSYYISYLKNKRIN